MIKLRVFQCFSGRSFQWLGRLPSLLVCGWLVACTGATTGTDTRTNWLSFCTTDNACGPELSCVCGVCTKACEAPSDCSSLGSGASCFEVQGCSAAGQVCAQPDFELGAFDQSPADAASASSASSSEAPASGSASSAAPSGSGTEDNGPGPLPTGASDSGGDASLDASSADASSADAGTATSSSSTTASSTSADASTVCDAPGRVYVSHDPAECTTPAECGILAEGQGNVPFSDSCGCGCEPYVPPPRTDSILENGCSGPNGGNPFPVAVLADSELSGQTTCFSIPNAIIRNDAELAEWVSNSGCSEVADAVSIINFTTQTLVIIGVQDRPLAHLAYTVQSIDGRIHFGVQANAYCGGARPPWGFVAIGLDATPAPVQISVETCFDDCVLDGGPPPP
jgi:hypothetical protein